MNSLMKKVVFGLVGVVLISATCFFLFFNKKSTGNDFKLEEASAQTSTTQEETTEKVEIITSDLQKELEKTLEEAKAQLATDKAALQTAKEVLAIAESDVTESS